MVRRRNRISVYTMLGPIKLDWPCRLQSLRHNPTISRCARRAHLRFEVTEPNSTLACMARCVVGPNFPPEVFELHLGILEQERVFASCITAAYSSLGLSGSHSFKDRKIPPTVKGSTVLALTVLTRIPWVLHGLQECAHGFASRHWGWLRLFIHCCLGL